jgi:hypothetical protein
MGLNFEKCAHWVDQYACSNIMGDGRVLHTTNQNDC